MYFLMHQHSLVATATFPASKMTSSLLLSSDAFCRPLSGSPHPRILPVLFSLQHPPCLALPPPRVSSLLPLSSDTQSLQVNSHPITPQSTHPSFQSHYPPWPSSSSPPHFPWALDIPSSLSLLGGYSYPVRCSTSCAFKTDTVHSTHRLWHPVWSITAPGSLTQSKRLGEGIVHGEEEW